MGLCSRVTFMGRPCLLGREVMRDRVWSLTNGAWSCLHAVPRPGLQHLRKWHWFVFLWGYLKTISRRHRALSVSGCLNHILSARSPTDKIEYVGHTV